MKTYKATNKDIKCSGFQFIPGMEYEHQGELILCKSGFHSCTDLFKVQQYYSPANSRIWECEIGEEFLKEEVTSKVCSRKITLVRELSFYEVMQGFNKTENGEESLNIGFGNHGNNNHGSGNHGNCNRGNCNRGNRNYGSGNIGNYNNGNNNNGNNNHGNYNRGNDNHGNYNNGNFNRGNSNNGNYNNGNFNNGNFNRGNLNHK